jgi:hypothetical protein
MPDQQRVDNETAYGHDQDREPPQPAGSDGTRAADRNPDDFGPDSEDGAGVNPATGTEYGQVDTPRL